MINLKELTIGQAEELAAMFGRPTLTQNVSHPYNIGKNYFIRTVTMAYTGRLVAVYEHELVLECACWIADTGRFMQAVATGIFSEVEPFPQKQVPIGRGALVDACEIETLPTAQK